MFNQAKMINDIIKSFAESLATIDDHDADNLSHSWEFYDDTNDVEIELKSWCRRNNSCSCHPEYEFAEHETHHTIPVATIESYFSEYENFGYVDVHNDPIIAERKKKKEELKRLELEAVEVIRKRNQQEVENRRINFEKQEFDRLAKLYGKE